jgi:hypothetical protein
VSLAFVERSLFIDGIQHEMESPIDDALEYTDMAVILFDPDSSAER